MNDRQRDKQTLYRLLSPPEQQADEAGDPRPSLLPWCSYALLGLLTVIIVTAGVLALLPIG
ncbi:MAG: hypothetical protein ACRDJE_19350 [Dehalococcoidia bacterium]